MRGEKDFRSLSWRREDIFVLVSLAICHLSEAWLAAMLGWTLCYEKNLKNSRNYCVGGSILLNFKCNIKGINETLQGLY